MELNADFSQRVAVHAAQLPWVASPIVRYAPAIRFWAHTHGLQVYGAGQWLEAKHGAKLIGMLMIRLR